jgi:hypothetical protein
MSGCNKIDIMTADLLKVDHHVCQIFILNLLPSSFMGDWPVLAEYATEIAVGEENGARPFSSHQRHLFTKMRVITKNNWLDWRSTESLLSLLPIHATLPGAELAIFENGISSFDPLGQFPFILKSFVGWDPSLFLPQPGESGNR